jgi:hypothetical protein
MNHVVLLGDSIFDNARYVPDRPAVIDQLRKALPAGWRASLLAVDGHITEDVQRQLAELPADASHLVVSAGGNEIILREAFLAGLPVIDLRLVCDRASDYSHVSSIEPSMAGGAKIAAAIAQVVTTHDFARQRSIIYV